MQEEESRSFRLKWRLVDWNRLRIRIRLRYTSVAEPHEPWSDVLEVNRHALQRKRSTRDQYQVVSRQHEVGYCIRGREFSTPDDIRDVARPVLRHRLALRAEAELDGATPDVVISDILKSAEVPR